MEGLCDEEKVMVDFKTRYTSWALIRQMSERWSLLRQLLVSDTECLLAETNDDDGGHSDVDDDDRQPNCGFSTQNPNQEFNSNQEIQVIICKLLEKRQHENV